MSVIIPAKPGIWTPQGCRRFVGASTQAVYWNNPAGAVVEPLPITLAIWFVTTTTSLQVMWNSIRITGSLGAVRLETDNLKFQATYRVSSTSRTSDFTGTPADGKWHHIAGIFKSTASRTVYADGVAGTENTALDTNTFNPDRWAVGGSLRSTPALMFTGLLAHAARWSAELTPTEIAQLAKGKHPASVRPESLVMYWPLSGDQPAERDLAMNVRLLENGGPTRDNYRGPQLWW